MLTHEQYILVHAGMTWEKCFVSDVDSGKPTKLIEFTHFGESESLYIHLWSNKEKYALCRDVSKANGYYSARVHQS